ncbi:MAG TPA: FAD-dependent oxidoreductase [Candidatus Acidoferrales bacterium]|nr:FAD-dependent oxidoreductase [Candidatus Acidoferrales bacterium]
MPKDPTIERVITTCCIAGGGPAGMMLGFLLARAGVDVVVLEKYKDFLRDFRGDTVHPSTLEVLYELGLLEDFLRRPHQEVRNLVAYVGPHEVPIADLSHLPTRCKFVALMPQWDFLNFLAERAQRYPGFHLRLESEATDILVEGERVKGVTVKTKHGELQVLADLVVAADGRHSTIRARAGFEVMQLGAPIDVLWMRMSRVAGDPEQSLGRVDAGKFLVMLNRSDYWQCAFVIPKGGFDTIRAAGLAGFQNDIAEIAPFLSDRVAELQSWDDVKLLSVAVDRLRQWYRDGLLCIGDAAHAMSPIGGIGINLAIQDAVAAANIVSAPLRDRTIATADLRRVQDRRMFPTRATQRLQVFAQDRIVRPALKRTAKITRLPWPLKVLRSWPLVRRIPARIVGMGFRPEHVKTPAFARENVPAAAR